MKVRHLDHLNLSVSNLAESVDWYGRVFGFEVQEQGVTEGVAFAIIRSGEAMLCMYEHPKFTHQGNVERRRAKLHGVSHFALRITDVDEWRETVEREQLELRWGGEVDWPHSTAWYVADPTGYEIEVAAWDHDEVKFPPLADAPASRAP